MSELLVSLDFDGRVCLVRKILDAARERRTLRLGIMGGTFDPIHYGHLVTGDQALHQYHLDVVLYMVAARPALKEASQVSDLHARLRMTRTALVGHHAMFGSSYEMLREGVSYTIDTLKGIAAEGEIFAKACAEDGLTLPLQKRKKSAGTSPSLATKQTGSVYKPTLFDITFITGLDAVCSIMQWERPQEIFAYAHVVAATRPGYTTEEAHRALEEVSCPNGVEIMPIPSLGISSSKIRELIRSGQSARYLTCDSVLKYANDNRVYLGTSTHT